MVAALSPEFGLVEVRAGQDRVQVVFHLEDVWDSAGQPALLSPGLSMQALQGRPVDLTARSVCRESEPNKILGLQDCLQQPAPLLQAVLVCLAPGATQQIPRPSQLRVGPGQLGAQDSPAHFYLNPLLGTKLDTKMTAFLGLPGGPCRPPDRFLRRGLRGLAEERRVVAALRLGVDSGTAWRAQYGGLDTPLERCKVAKHLLPRVLTSQPVRPLLLHKAAASMKVRPL